jgi:hypothetical protein
MFQIQLQEGSGVFGKISGPCRAQDRAVIVPQENANAAYVHPSDFRLWLKGAKVQGDSHPLSNNMLLNRLPL